MRWHRKAEWSNGNVKSIVRNVFERNNCVYVTKFNDQNIKRSRHWRWKNYLCASSKFFSIKVLSFHSPRAYWPLFMACSRLNGLQAACLKSISLIQSCMQYTVGLFPQLKSKSVQKIQTECFFNFIYGFICSFENGNNEQNDKNERTFMKRRKWKNFFL